VNPAGPVLPEAVAPPRDNGELQFEAPWQGRVFSLALALHANGVFTWSEFSPRLAKEIAAHRGPTAASVLPTRDDTTELYYLAWAAALEGLLIDRDVLTDSEVEQREHEVGRQDDHAH